jgi:hypothetical protein
MKWTRAITTVTIVLMACSNGAEGSSLPRFPKGVPYAEARQSLKALGYRPNALPDADAVSRDRCGYKPDSVTEPKTSAGDGDDMRCFPERSRALAHGLVHASIRGGEARPLSTC